MIDINTLIVTTLVNDKYNVLHCYLPSLFNSDNNIVLDIFGNIHTSGGIRVEKDVIVENNSFVERDLKIKRDTLTNSIQPYINGNGIIPTLNIATNSSQKDINIGSNENEDKIFLRGQMYIYGRVGFASSSICTIGNNISTDNAESYTTESGQLIVYGGVGITSNVNIGGNVTITKAVKVNLNTDSGNTTTGALVVSGGAGVGGNIYVGGNLDVTKAVKVNIGTESESTVTGALVVSGGAGIGGNIHVGGNVTITKAVKVNLNTDSGNTTTGALIVTGGAGIGGNIYVGGNVDVTSSMKVNSATESGNTITGALIVTGGAGIGKDVNIGGNATISKIVTALSYNALSDYRIKTNITPLDENYNVKDLNPVHYYNNMNGNWEIGFIAHELEEKYPFLVNGVKDDKNNYQSINYNGMIGILTNEIKMLKNKGKFGDQLLQLLENSVLKI
jgi:hypothetical protein